MEYRGTLTSARECGEAGKIEEWVHAYLGSDPRNHAFLDGLKLCPRVWMGPLTLPADRLKRICGPEEGMPFRVDAGGFEEKTRFLMGEIARGEDLPPLIVHVLPDGEELNDGNHRFEAYRRLGIGKVPVILWATEGECGPDPDTFFAAFLDKPGHA